MTEPGRPADLKPDRPADLKGDDTWCWGCGAIWRAGSRICHCGACHATFGGITDFDAHQGYVCGRCTVDEPCQSAHHLGDRRVVCLPGVSAALRIVSELDGRYRARGGDVGRLRAHGSTLNPEFPNEDPE